MASFNERKAARIEAMRAGVKYEFQVIERNYDGKIVGTFDSRKLAEEFAWQQLGSLVGNTAAYRAWVEMQTSKAFIPNTDFRVQRVVK